LPRYLALDWDQQQLHVVEASVGGGAVRVLKAVVWAETDSPSVAGADSLAKKLRDRMKEAKIAPAPVLICLGRDRVILKDVRYPAVPASEEPAVVRFQTIKELTEAPEDAVIDYLPLDDNGNGSAGDRHALAVVARREQIAAFQAICRAAGLKLLGITPRAFGMAACAFRLAGASVLTPAVEPPDAPVGVLAVADHWAEFCVSRGGNLVFTRSLAIGEGLAGEVRRNLALFNGQSSRGPVQALYVAGMGEQASLRERLQATLDIPVHTLDPFGGAERSELPSQKRGAFIGAVGLLHAQGSRSGLPINFAQPKQPRPPRDPNRKKVIYAAAAAALFLIVGVAFCYSKLAAASAEVTAKQHENEELDRKVAELEEQDKRFKAIRDWSDAGLDVLDEIYDLADRIADPRAIRVNEISVDPIQRTAKEKAAVKFTVKGVAKTKTAVDDLADGFTRDQHYDVGAKNTSANGSPDTKADFAFTFELPVKVKKPEPTAYRRQLPAPAGGDRSFGR
jgi:Tfp pilus assembly PilM family ATPase